MSYIDNGMNYGYNSNYHQQINNYNPMQYNQPNFNDKNRNYLNQLKAQMIEQNKKPNKLQQLREKMNEREELERNISYNPFGKGGNGAPLRDQFGNVITARKGISTNLYLGNQSSVQIDYNRNNSANINNNISQNNNSAENINNNFYSNLNKNELTYNFSKNNYQNFRQNNMENINTYLTNNIPNENYRNYSTTTSQAPNYQNQQNFQSLPNQMLPQFTNHFSNPLQNFQKYQQNNNYQVEESKLSLNNNNTNNNYDTQIETSKIQSKQNYQNELLKQIEEKKKEKDIEKKKAAEAERLDEEKYQQYLQIKKNQEDQAKLKKKKNITEDERESNHYTMKEGEVKKNTNTNTNPNNANNYQTNINTHHHKNLVTSPSPQQENINNLYSYPKNVSYEAQLREREEYDVQRLKEAINHTYSNIHRTIKEDTNAQIMKLKSEVNRQYSEINDIFNKLRMDVNEAASLKFEAERELNKIKDEIENRKLTHMLYEEKLNQVLDKHAPYNNLHIPYDQVNPLPNKFKHNNLKSTSTMVYTKEEFLEEKEDQRGYQRNVSRPMSKLAQRGQNLMGDSEFIPIVTPPNKEEYEQHNNGINLNSQRTGQNNFENYSNINTYNSYGDMNNKLDEIAKLNSEMDPSNKYRSMKINFENDIGKKVENVFIEESEL